MIDYLCLNLLADRGEDESDFKARLAAFWTHMLRNKPNDYEKVYAEATAFGLEDGRISRQYMVEAPVLPVILTELSAWGICHSAVDPDEIYSKYEASSPDWFQIDH